MTCLFCKNSFCSYKCVRSHIITSHNNNLLINTQQSTNNIYQKTNKISNQEKKDIILSPYIIEGIFYKSRQYDEKFNIDNFLSVLENGKPKVIGGGSFGQIFLVNNIKNNKLYAIKHMIKANLSKKLNSLESIYKEIDIQSRIDHPNILPILYVKETAIDFDLVLDYSNGGSLFYFIRKRRYLDENIAFSLFIQVVNAVYFLHKNDLIHRDIKPENILLFDNNIIKLCDFGWCVKLEDGQQRGTYCGTTEYMSPELVNHKGYSKEIDIWSLGVLLYEMVHGYSPFKPEKPYFNSKDVINNIKMHRLKFNKNISQRCKELIYHLLEEKPETRYKVEDIFNSDFVKYYENKSYSFPDKFLFEKYKFKISKVQNILYPKNKNERVFINRFKEHKKSSTNIINQRSNIFEGKNKDNEFNDNLSNIEKNINKMNSITRKRFPSYLTEENFDNSQNIYNRKKIEQKKMEKNKTYEYFPSLTIIDNKINISLLGDSKSNNNLKFIKVLGKNSNSIKNDYNIIQKKENEEIIKEQELSKNETKIKTIIINNYFPNLIQKNDSNNEQTETKKDLTYKKNFHIKPLKMSKIPKSNKFSKINLSMSNNNLNALLNYNYLMIKKHLTPKIKLYTENKTVTDLSKKNVGEDKGEKIIEDNKNKNCHSSKILKEIPYQFNFKTNQNIRKYTRNMNNYLYDSIKDNNKKYYYSKDYYSRLNINNSMNNNHTKNNSFSNLKMIDNIIDFNQKKKYEGKIHHTKSLNLLNINFKNENIKSMFISNSCNKNINSVSINSENKYLLNANNKNRVEGNKYNLNFHRIHKVNTNIYKTKQNSPSNNFNNNFVHTIFNRCKLLDKQNKENFSFSNNISMLNIYDFNKVQSLNKQNNPKSHLEKESNKNYKLQIPIKKYTKLEIKNNTSIIMPKRNNNYEIKNKKNENNKKLKNVPRINNKKNVGLNININTDNNTSKNYKYEKCICKNQNYLNNRDNITNINSCSYKNKNHIKNNSNRCIANEKLKIMKKLGLNNILNIMKSNKNKRIDLKKNKDYSFNENIKKNESYFNNNSNIEEINQKYKKYLIIKNNKDLDDTEKLFPSRNMYNCENINHLNTSNNNKIIYKTNYNNSKNEFQALL